MTELNHRQFLGGAAAAVAGATLPSAASAATVPTTPSIERVVVIGSGLGGGVSALRLISGLRDESPPQARLLLLHVVGHDRRTERLFDELCLRWRPLGTVELIAGQDLAYRNVDPGELYGFLTGALSREFVKDAQHLALRPAQLDERQDLDGLYRVSSYFCHRDTWKTTLDALAAGCDAVLMDLRGFGPAHSGCQYEIRRLAEHLGHKPIVLLIDSPAAELAEGLQIDGALSDTVGTAIQLLLGRQPA